MSRPRAYLAGPEVFLTEGAAIIAAKNDLALAYGFLPNGIAGLFVRRKANALDKVADKLVGGGGGER